MSRSLEARLRKVEERHRAAQPAKPGIWIVTHSDKDQAQQLAAMEAAGTYTPGDIVVAWRIVEPPARHP